MCVFFGYQDDSHLYYVHLGKKTDDHANQVFIVNEAPRTKISTKTTDGIPWLDYALPYIEWSSIIKDESAFNDSQLFILGTAWARGGWYIYSDLAYSDGNYFVGNERDNYGRIDGVGDFGVAGNDKWNYRFNLNLGYYY